MRVLVCAATAFERAAWGDPDPDETLIVSGVGVPATFAGLVRQERLPELVVNIGIAGAYRGAGLSIGDLVVGQSDVYGDIGFELPDAPGFQRIADAAFGAFYREPYPLVMPAWLCDGLPVGRGCTVGTCTGTDTTGALRESLFDAAFETMEGAAVAQLGAAWGVPVCQVRAISNFAGRRDMRPENIRKALDRLAEHLTRCRRAVK